MCLHIAPVLNKASIAVKRHQGHSNSYKGKAFYLGGLYLQRFSPFWSWCGLVAAGRHGAELKVRHPAVNSKYSLIGHLVRFQN